MESTELITKQKTALLKKFEKLKVGVASETKIEMLGECGRVHIIDSDLDPDLHGISFKQFFTFENLLFMCVGIGEICSENESDRQVLWFVEKNSTGIFHFGIDTFQELVGKQQCPSDVHLLN